MLTLFIENIFSLKRFSVRDAGDFINISREVMHYGRAHPNVALSKIMRHLPFILVTSLVVYLVYQMRQMLEQETERAKKAHDILERIVRQPGKQEEAQKSLIRKTSVNYKDLIGLGRPIERLKMIQEILFAQRLAERYPSPAEVPEEIYAARGIEPPSEAITKMGLKHPRAILFEGPPGVGKTMLAKAFANETKANFFYASGSSFLKKYVGEGADTVRNLFATAAAVAPSIIFIDEIDAFTKTRGDRSGGGKEVEATLNELLTQIEGFRENKNIIVIGATNLAERLDKALRDRFTHIITFNLPDAETSTRILRHYTYKHPEESFELGDENKLFEKLGLAAFDNKISPRKLEQLVDNTFNDAYLAYRQWHKYKKNKKAWKDAGKKIPREKERAVVTKEDFKLALNKLRREQSRLRQRQRRIR